MAQFELKQVRKAYGNTKVIHGVDFQAEDGEFVVLVGPSGCGKSTILRMIAGLEPVTSGQIRIEGADVTRVPASDRGLAMVFQSYALYPHMTVWQNMSFGLENVKTPRKEIETRIAEAARLLQIEAYLDRRPKALSGGQRQRVAIGRAIVRDPKIFLFDEPLSNLDAELRVSMRKELAALHAKIGGTMVYVTHDQIEAMTLADKIVVLRDGRVEQVGRPLDLYFKPANRFVAGFIGSPRMNFLPLQWDGGVARLQGDQSLETPNGTQDATEIGVRPEHFLPVGPGQGLIDVTVTLTEELGGETYIYAASEAHDEIRVKSPGVHHVTRGERIGLSVKPDQIIWFRGDETIDLGEPAL